MKIKANLSIAAAIAAAMTFASTAGATEIVTSSYSAWLGTISGSATEGNFTIPNSTYDTASGFSLTAGSFGPIAVTGPDGSGYVLNKDSYSYGSYSLTTLQGAGDGVGDLKFTTPVAGLTGFLISVGISGNAAPISLTLSDGEAFSLTPSVGGMVTLGLSSATPITSFVLATSAGSEVQFADFWAGTSNEPAAPTAPAAEIATAIMIGSGLLLIGARRKVFSNISRALA
jgi:hypothetical protein